MWRDPHHMPVSWVRLHVWQLLYPQINRVVMHNGEPHLPLDAQAKCTGKWWE